MQTLIEVVHPVLPSQDISVLISFYMEKLGFKLLFQDQPDNPGTLVYGATA